jgi:hypothetical protein
MKLASLLEGMPSSVIKQKQKLGMMTTPEFKEYIINLAKEKNRTPEEQAARLERLHVVKPGGYTSKLK